jgi:molybdenum cofactor cytidylyltransferase
MGTPKALLPWGDSTLLEHALTVIRAVGVDDMVVVLGPATEQLALGVKTVVNPTPESGRSASIRLGVSALQEVEAILIQSVDQPTSREVIDALFNASGEVVVPTYGGRRGHPIVLSGALRRELESLSEETQGLRSVVRSHEVTEVAVEDESVTWNLNDPEAYAAAMARQ